MNTRMYRRVAGLTMILVLLLSACTSSGRKDPNEEFHVAFNAQPPSLDPLMSTANATQDIARNIFEPLVALDAEGEVQPVIASGWDVSDDGKKTTFELRRDVKFHNGNKVTAEDVAASLTRWIELSSMGTQFFEGATAEVVDSSHVAVTTVRPMRTVLDLLADPGQPTAIMPANIVNDAPVEGITEFVGTGPFRFVEWRTDQYVELKKFEEYQPPSGEQSGLAGHREARVDVMRIDFVTDPSTRLAGLQTGEYQVATSIPYDSSELIERDTTLQTVVKLTGFNGAVFNKKSGPMSNQLLRQAATAAMDIEAVQTAAYASPKFFDLEGGLSKKSNKLYSDAGLEHFNEHDLDKARALMKEAGYNNEPIRILTSREYEDQYNSAVVVEDNLKKAGFNASLLVTDWPTLLSTRTDENAYELFTTGWQVTNLPTQQVFFVKSWPGWTDDEQLTEYLNGITFAKDDEEQKEAARKLQERFYEYQPIIKYGNSKEILGASAQVEGLRFETGAGILLWDVHMNEDQ